ncbi:MAG TPA: TM0106 family RecB-like putative nuclease [Arthrobacter sp.]
MFILPSVDPDGDGDLVISASDIISADTCGFAAVRKLDAILGRVDAVPAAPDEMLELTAALGERHERTVLDGLKVRYGAGVYEMPVSAGVSRPALESRHRDTLAALRAGYDVIYQGSFFDGTFHGRADFLIRSPDGRWIVHDTKLARSAKPAALLQLAAYAGQLTAAGLDVHEEGRLILGDGSVTAHALAGPAALYTAARTRLQNLLAVHRAETGPAAFSDPRWGACLKSECPDCSAAIAAADDLMLVRGMNRTRRAALHAAGITTATGFAAAPADPGADKLGAALHLQARMQAGTADADGTRNGVSYKVTAPEALETIPATDAGDIFFDFEGDPNWQDESTGEWGIEYLFGLLDEDGKFVPFTAHSIAAERQAFTDFMEHVAERRRTFPGLHIYHYAPYEVTALKKLAARHGIYAGEVAELVDSGVLFDLLKVVRAALVTSERSFSIKKMEPLYMPDHRSGVATAVDSLVQYARYGQAVSAGDTHRAAAIFQAITDYNTYDCLSTLKLRDWLLSLRTPATVPAA